MIPWPNRNRRTELDRLSWSKKSTISQSTVGGLFVFGESALGRNGGPVCGNRNLEEYSTLGGGRRHGRLVTGRSISMGLPALTPQKYHNQPWFGSVGAELTRKRRSGCVLWRAFLWNYGRQGGFKASLNCDQEDEFDLSAQFLASKTWQSISVRQGVGSDGRGKAQWLGVQEGKSTIFIGGGG